MSISYNLKFMTRTTKLVLEKLCPGCKKVINFKYFRKIKPLRKGPNKYKFIG
jgi:hypothetical protein